MNEVETLAKDSLAILNNTEEPNLFTLVRLNYLITKLCYYYYVENISIVSDEEFDKLWDKLHSIYEKHFKFFNIRSIVLNKVPSDRNEDYNSIDEEAFLNLVEALEYYHTHS